MAQSGTTVYSGRFEHTLDDKNRLTIPSLWRWAHTDTETFLAMPHPDGYIAVLPPARVAKLLAQVSEMKLSDRDAQAVKAKIFSEALSFTFDTSLLPSRVIEAARDFTDERGEVFPAVEAGHFEVHSIDDDHADVTEGTGTGIGTNWERCRYDWSPPGTVIAAVTDSNVYAPGSHWTITACTSDGLSDV